MILPLPTPHERGAIGHRAVMSDRQIVKVYRTPEKCRPSTVERVRRAARALGIPEPMVPEPLPATERKQ